jgi:hypothetical protein
MTPLFPYFIEERLRLARPGDILLRRFWEIASAGGAGVLVERIMYLDRSRSVSFISVLALIVAWGCSSKKADSGADNGVGTGGSGYCPPGTPGCGAGGAGTDSGSTGGTSTLGTDYCGGILSGQVCGQTSVQADVRNVNMLLVIDESGSMTKPPSKTDTRTKWAEMNLALSGALPTFQDDINFGLLLFPYNPAGIDPNTATFQQLCAVPDGATAINVGIASGADNLRLILNTVQGQTPVGGTPTANALLQAYKYFTQGDGKALKGSKWILLATDGGPNCNSSLTCDAAHCTPNREGDCQNGSMTANCCDISTAQLAALNENMSCLDDQAVFDQITNLAGVGVGTYVIGIPGSEVYAATLNEMAKRGGVPNPAGATGGSYYYAVSATNTVGDLQTALDGIITQLVKTCDIKLNQSPNDPSTVQVVKDCVLVPQIPGNTPAPVDGGVDGFYINYDENPAHLILTGSYCQSIMTAGANQVSIVEGCHPIQ